MYFNDFIGFVYHLKEVFGLLQKEILINFKLNQNLTLDLVKHLVDFDLSQLDHLSQSIEE